MSTRPATRSAEVPRVDVLDRLCEAAGAVNEDRIGCGQSSHWVLDGATGLGEKRLAPGQSDAQWLVESLDRHLRESELPESPEQWVRRVLLRTREEFATSASGRFPPERFELPSAALALAGFTGREIVCVSLGDSRVLVRLPDRPLENLLGSPLLEALDDKVIERIVELHEAGCRTHGDVRKRVLPILRRHRALLNTDEGYWALGLEPEAAAHMRIRRYPRQPGARVLLVSDGLYRLVDTFDRYSDQELLSAAEEHGLTVLLEELRELEGRDPDCLRYPRLKPSDDASALLLRLS